MTVALRDDRHGENHDDGNDAVVDGSPPSRPRYDSVILASDARRGGIYSIDPLTGKHKFTQPDPNMIPTRPIPGIGINGLRVRGSYIYYVSNGILYRFRFSRQALFADLTLVKVEAVERIATLGSNDGGADDFALAEDGTAYVAGITQNAALKVTPNGSVSTIVGDLNDTSIAGPTSCFIDRDNPRRLYVTTSGGQTAPVNGNFVEPGKVAALHI